MTFHQPQNVHKSRASTTSGLEASGPKVALALAGGGPLGAIYEIGALCALDEALRGTNLNSCTHYVGVSAGGFIAAALANGMTPTTLRDLFIAPQVAGEETFDPAWLMRPAYVELAQRLSQLPVLSVEALWAWTAGRKSLISALEKLGPAVPTGLFSNEEVHLQIARLFSRQGRTNDFRKLGRRLTLVATHLDSGEAAPFGRAGWDHVPISRAIAASAAMPGLFPPVEIDGRHYVDGALKKTMHATVALDEGVDVMFCMNPLVPFDATTPLFSMSVRKNGTDKPIPPMVQGGFPAVMNQTFRSMIHSRLELGMKQYESNYPDTTIVLIEPDPRDAELYLANTFSYHHRRELAEHAYQQTRLLLLSQHRDLTAKLQTHGISLCLDTLRDPNRHLLPAAETVTARASVSQPKDARRRTTSTRLGRALDRLHSQVDGLQDTLQKRSSQTQRTDSRRHVEAAA